ncbi:MAG: hypothetical protein M0C28_05405 [Candidatus Moduliflexus flocculans]|nr:hypothetical protein [Candidatus Moduliflexus flocculans]
MGGGGGEDAQPFQLNSPFGIIMAHNGNVANYRELRERALRDEPPPPQLRLRRRDHPQPLRRVPGPASGPRTWPRSTSSGPSRRSTRRSTARYSVVAYIAGQGMVAFRDPYGIKPLVYGVRRDGLLPSYAFASESGQPRTS